MRDDGMAGGDPLSYGFQSRHVRREEEKVFMMIAE
jgi:hypothetical protein